MMIIDHAPTSINLQQKYTPCCSFFASQRSYGYALSQENNQHNRVFSLRTLKEVAP